MSATEIDFETGVPIWMVQIYHQQPDQSKAIWGRALNAENEHDAVLEAAKLFVDEGLNAAYVTEVFYAELLPLSKEVNDGTD